MRTTRTPGRLLLTPLVVLAVVLAACGGGGDDTTTTAGGGEEITLRVAMGSPGDAQIKVWEAAKEAFEATHENVTIEYNFQEPNLYETTGLPVLLSSNEAPDVYFEWAGERLRNRHADGYAADITDLVNNGPLSDIFDEGAFNGMVIDDQIVMVPSNADVTNVYWYNVAIFDELGLDVPTTWDEFLDVARALKAADYVPIGTGNKDLWPGGNWIAHQISRVIGEDAYDQLMKREIPMNDPSVIAALDTASIFHEEELVNASIAGSDDTEGAQLFFQGLSGMHPIGSWLVSWAIEEAPDLDFDYFNMPAMDGDGVQDSVIGVSTGHVVNANSQHIELAVEFLEVFSSPDIVALMVEAGGTPLAEGALDRDDVDPRVASLMEMMSSAGALVAPPDVGYDLEVAGALNAAIAEVLGGQKTAEQALNDAEAKLG